MGFAIIECEPSKVTNILHLMFNWVKSFLIKVLHSFWHCWERFCDRIAYEQNFLDFISVSAFSPFKTYLLSRNPDEQLCQNIDVLLKSCEWQIRTENMIERSRKFFRNLINQMLRKHRNRQTVPEKKIKFVIFPSRQSLRLFTEKSTKPIYQKLFFLHILCHQIKSSM